MKKHFARLLAASTLLLAVGFSQSSLAADPPAAKTEAPAASAPAASAPAAAAAPAASAPAPVPNKGDVAWMSVSTLLVILMAVPGLALFYGGLVRSKNMLSILMQVFVVFSL